VIEAAVTFETLAIVHQITLVTCHKAKLLSLTTFRKKDGIYQRTATIEYLPLIKHTASRLERTTT